jgi:nucleoside-diphosphate-sugar epimerase
MADILVTGASGYVGRALMTTLAERGHDPAPLCGRLSNTEQIMKACHGMRTILHCAAELHNRDQMYDTNVLGTKHLGRIASQLGVRHFVYVSTASIRSPSTYVETKRQGEHEIKLIGMHSGMNITIVRLPTLYGSGRGPYWYHALRLLWQGRPLNLATREEGVKMILEAL